MVTCAARSPKEQRYLYGYFKRAGAFMLCCALVFSLTLPPRAKAAEAISVGLIGSLVGVVMASLGFTWASEGMDVSGFGDALAGQIQNFLNSEFDGMSIAEWADVCNLVEDFIEKHDMLVNDWNMLQSAIGDKRAELRTVQERVQRTRDVDRRFMALVDALSLLLEE